MEIQKYPRTRHIEGSRLQVGDMSDDKPLAELRDQDLTIEEKLDGANSALSFDASGTLLLQSRGHYLTGGWRERHFDLFKTWANTQSDGLRQVLGQDYIMYGEWMFAKHTVFYDQLPHYFLEFDVLHKATGVFLSTDARRDLLKGLPIMPVPVLGRQPLENVKQINGFVLPSLYKSANWRDALARETTASGSREEFVQMQTEDSELAEGVYLKLENEGQVVDRFKFVRSDFLQAIEAAQGHWLDRPILQNRLAEGVDIFAPVLGVQGAYDDPEIM